MLNKMELVRIWVVFSVAIGEFVFVIEFVNRVSIVTEHFIKNSKICL